MVVLATVFPGSARGQTEADSTAQPDTTQRTPNPRTALMLGLIPGGGQIYNGIYDGINDGKWLNGKWLKALIVVAVDGYYIRLFQQNRDYYNRYDEFDPPLPFEREHYLGERNRLAWRVLFVYILGLLDGYIDAHLSTFPPDSSYQAQSLPPSNQPVEEDQ